MNKKIALVSPNMNGTKNGVNRIQPSHAIALLAAILRQEGYEVFVRDTALEGYDNQVPYGDGKMVAVGESDEKIASWVSAVKPDYLGISILFSNLAPHAWNIARITKKINPGIKVVVGGNHISNAVSDYFYYEKNPNSGMQNPLKFLESGHIDYVMWGECDNALVEFISKHSSGKDFKDTRGLVFFDGEKYIVNSKPLQIANLDVLPLEARDLMNMEKYFEIGRFHSPKGDKRVGNVRGSRGCAENCRFCTIPELFGSPIRWRSPQKVYEEILILKDNYRITEIQFEDDSLTANIKWLRQICELISPLKLRWCTPNGLKINYHAHNPNIQKEMFLAMRNSGCYQVSFGVESGVQNVLNNIIDKKLRLEVVFPTIAIAKEAGLLVHSFYMVGFPGETREQMEKTIEFAASSGSDSFSLAIFSPLPGTPLLYEVYKKGLWWDPTFSPEKTLFTRSLIKVDGFSCSEEFEKWVEEKNIYLNSLLKIRDPERFAYKYGSKASESHLKHQT